MLVSGCREQGDFGPPGSGFISEKAFAWPLTRGSFSKWADVAGLRAVDEVWRLYNSSSSTPRQMWNQLGTDLTLFCGLRATVEGASPARASPIYLNIFSFAISFVYMGMVDVEGAVEGIDMWLTWGQSAATIAMGVTLPEEAVAVGDKFRGFLVEFARTGVLGKQWQPYPAVCEYGGSGLGCSEENSHARACAIFDEELGREKFVLSLG